MSRIQLTEEISDSLRQLEKTSQEGSHLSITKGFGFTTNQLSTLERYANLIATTGNLTHRYHALLQQDTNQAEALIEQARNQDASWARAMEGTL